LSSALRTRLIRSYGTIIFTLLNNIDSIEAMGSCFGADLYELEINFLIEHEWAINVEDIIWRRTKRGLYLSMSQVAFIQQYIDKHPSIVERKSLQNK
jgi:glycerol-3-phosphate dehydrogenase